MNGYEFEKITRKKKFYNHDYDLKKRAKNRTIERNRGRYNKLIEQNAHGDIDNGASLI